MIDGSEKRNRQLAFELQNSHVCEKRSKLMAFFSLNTALSFLVHVLIFKNFCPGFLLKELAFWIGSTL